MVRLMAHSDQNLWPEIDPAAVDDFIDFLFSIDEKLCRPPRQAAKLLAFIVQLHTAPGGPRPFPTRKQVAAHLGISVPTIDAVINLHVAEGNLTTRTEFVGGNVKQRRASAKKIRYLIPSPVLLSILGGLR